MQSFLIILVFTFLVNVPFGYWRQRTRRLSPAWFVAVHGPVPLIAALRVTLGLVWRWDLAPLLVLAYFGGQLAGGRLRHRTA